MNESALDPVVFNEIRELMDDALGAFIETYLDNSPKLLANIEQALSSSELEPIFHDAHQLKGGSGSLGAMQVFQLAKQMEEQAREGNAEGLDQLFAELQSAYQRVAAELQGYL